MTLFLIFFYFSYRLIKIANINSNKPIKSAIPTQSSVPTISRASAGKNKIAAKMHPPKPFPKSVRKEQNVIRHSFSMPQRHALALLNCKHRHHNILKALPLYLLHYIYREKKGESQALLHNECQ